MSNLEIITAQNADQIDKVGQELAETYKIAFAGPPWNERSRCEDAACTNTFSALEPGCVCGECGNELTEAYNTAELTGLWKQMLVSEGAYMEIEYEGNFPQRATLARPTDANELFERKYVSSPLTKEWLSQKFSSELVWIEDTFANRERKATGNLDGRGQTLKRIANFFGGLQIATRTLSPAIVAATVRDVPSFTAAYIGSEDVGRDIVNTRFNNPGYELPTVPDNRTLLVVKTMRGVL